MDWLTEHATNVAYVIAEETGDALEKFASTFTCKYLLTDGSTINVHYHPSDAGGFMLPNYDPSYGVIMEAIGEYAVDFKVIMPDFVSHNLSKALHISMDVMKTTLTCETLDDAVIPIMGEITVLPHAEGDEPVPNPLIKSVEIYLDVDQI